MNPEQEQKRKATFTLPPEVIRMLDDLGGGNKSQTVTEALKTYFYTNAVSSEKLYILNSKLLEIMHKEEAVDHEILYLEQEQKRLEKKLDYAAREKIALQEKRKSIETEISSLDQYNRVEEKEIRELALNFMRSKKYEMSPEAATEKYSYLIQRELDNKLIPRSAILEAFRYAEEKVREERAEEKRRLEAERAERMARRKNNVIIVLNDIEKRVLKPVGNFYRGEQQLRKRGKIYCRTPEEFKEKYGISLKHFQESFSATPENIDRVVLYLYQNGRSR